MIRNFSFVRLCAKLMSWGVCLCVVVLRRLACCVHRNAKLLSQFVALLPTIYAFTFVMYNYASIYRRVQQRERQKWCETRDGEPQHQHQSFFFSHKNWTTINSTFWQHQKISRSYFKRSCNNQTITSCVLQRLTTTETATSNTHYSPWKKVWLLNRPTLPLSWNYFEVIPNVSACSTHSLATVHQLPQLAQPVPPWPPLSPFPHETKSSLRILLRRMFQH